MKCDIKLFIIPSDRVPAGPPQPAETLSVEAANTDGIFGAVRIKVAERGLKLRSISFGPQSLVVYAEEKK